MSRHPEAYNEGARVGGAAAGEIKIEIIKHKKKQIKTKGWSQNGGLRTQKQNHKPTSVYTRSPSSTPLVQSARKTKGGGLRLALR